MLKSALKLSEDRSELIRSHLDMEVYGDGGRQGDRGRLLSCACCCLPHNTFMVSDDPYIIIDKLLVYLLLAYLFSICVRCL